MGHPYNKNAATYDADARSVSLRAVRGDTFEASVEMFLERPNPYLPGEKVEEPVDAVDLSWDSLIYGGNRVPVGSFTIIDDAYAGNRVTLTLTATETAEMKPGSYGFWVDTVNADSGVRRTWLRGTLTITEKP